jgi:protein-S-isoprenylcysteine O-methyltransferase Ste14
MVKKIYERLVSPALMWLIVIIGIIIFISYTPKTRILSLGYFGAVIFFITLLYWIYYFALAIIVHRRAALSVAGIKKIVDYGVYSRVRHPIYSADIILALGVFFFFPSINILISIIWLAVVLIIWMFLEEKLLILKFGQDYKDYKKKVPMFFPYKYK